MKKYLSMISLLVLFSFAFLGLEASAQSASCFTNQIYYLQYGSRDSSTKGEVTKLQNFLIQKGFLGANPSGYFGPATKAAAIAYQKSKGLPAQGLIGNMTRKVMNADGCGYVSDNNNSQIENSIKSTAQSVANSFGSQGTNIYYFKIVASKVYMLLEMDVNGWAGASNTVAKVHLLIEKALSEIPAVDGVVFDYAPGDKPSNSSLKINLTYPNGGENLISGQSHKIQWTGDKLADGSSSGVDIKLIVQDCKGECDIDQYIIKNALFTGSYNWTPKLIAGKYKIQVCRANTNICDTSDDWFTIASPVQTNTKTYYNSNLGFSFNYPNSWNLLEDNLNKTVTLTSDINYQFNGKTFPSYNLTFKVTDKSYFNSNRIITKYGIITYDEINKAIMIDGNCVSSVPIFNGTLSTVKGVTYGGSLMSDPAYSDIAISTAFGSIILVHIDMWEYNSDIVKQLVEVGNSFKLLNGNIMSTSVCKG